MVNWPRRQRLGVVCSVLRGDQCPNHALPVDAYIHSFHQSFHTSAFTLLVMSHTSKPAVMFKCKVGQHSRRHRREVVPKLGFARSE